MKKETAMENFAYSIVIAFFSQQWITYLEILYLLSTTNLRLPVFIDSEVESIKTRPVVTVFAKIEYRLGHQCISLVKGAAKCHALWTGSFTWPPNFYDSNQKWIISVRVSVT